MDGYVYECDCVQCSFYYGWLFVLLDDVEIYIPC